MTKIIKTDAIVLSRVDNGDTSRIVNFYTELHGRLGGIIRGAKSSKSAAGAVADVFNHIQLVYYFKPERDIQLISQTELNNNFTHIKEDFNKLKYGMVLLESVMKLTLENESNPLLFKALLRALKLINEGSQPEEITIRYLLFLARELGYEIQTELCISCNKKLNNELTYFNFDAGAMCRECGKDHLYHEKIQPELFEIIVCLNHKNKQTAFNKQLFDKTILFLERFLKFHNPGFAGFKSLGMD